MTIVLIAVDKFFKIGKIFNVLWQTPGSRCMGRLRRRRIDGTRAVIERRGDTLNAAENNQKYLERQKRRKFSRRLTK